MQSFEKTIDHGTLRHLVDTGTAVNAEVVANAGAWGVVIKVGRASQTLAATRGKPRTWRQFETLAGYLKDLGITQIRVDMAAFEPAATARVPTLRSAKASARMQQAHQAAAYDKWLRGQVQASIDDPRSSVADEEAQKRFNAKRQALLKAGGAGKSPAH